MSNSTEDRRLAWCETSTAGPMTPNHLREISPDEDLRTGGGVTSPTLCGRDLHGGWDLRVADQGEIAARADLHDGPGRVCARCAQIALPPSAHVPTDEQVEAAATARQRTVAAATPATPSWMVAAMGDASTALIAGIQVPHGVTLAQYFTERGDGWAACADLEQAMRASRKNGWGLADDATLRDLDHPDVATALDTERKTPGAELLQHLLRGFREHGITHVRFDPASYRDDPPLADPLLRLVQIFQIVEVRGDRPGESARALHALTPGTLEAW